MMRVPYFRYLAPSTIEAAALALRDEPGARLYAGGTDLLPNMKRRHQTPTTLIALRKIAALRQVTADASGLTLGAMLTLTEVAQLAELPTSQRALTIAAGKVATPHIRNAGTLGGNLCLDTRCNYYDQNYEWRRAIDFCKKAPGPDGTALPVVEERGVCWVAPGSPRCWAVSSSDTAPALIALGAEVTLVSADGARRIPLTELYHDDGMAYLTKQADELLTAVHLPAAGAGWRSTYWKLRRRGSFDFPVLGVGAAGKVAADGTVEALSLCLGAVGSRPKLVDTAALVGEKLTDAAIAAFVKTAAKLAKPMDNTDYGLAWRKRMATAYLTGALREVRGDDPASLGLLARTAARLPVLA